MYWKGKRTQLQDDNIVVMSADGELWANVPLYLDEVNHSPTGFEWGYWGSGPSQLAYAILRSYFELAGQGYEPELSKTLAKRYYMKFKNDFVGKWHSDEWTLSEDEIRTWVINNAEQWWEERKEGWV